jgi:outer membrane protein assembly factor BamB
VAWSFEAGGPIAAQAVIDTEGRVVFGALDGWLYVLSPQGELVWKKDLEGAIYASAWLDSEDNIYVGSDADYYWSFDSAGELRWRLQTEGDADTGTVAAPDGTLHFAAGRELWAVQSDGEVNWRFRAGEKIYSTPAVDDDGTVYFGSQDDHGYAVASDGRMRWSHRMRGDSDASPAVSSAGHVYMGSDDGNVYAFDRDGTLLWNRDLNGFVRAPLGVSRDGLVLASTFGPRPRLAALRPSDGEVQWYFPVTVADSAELGISSGALSDRQGNIYFGAHDDNLYALSAAGELRFAFSAQGDINATPILIGDGALLVGSGDRRLYKLAPSTP